MTSSGSSFWSPSRRLITLIAFGTMVITIELLFVYGTRIRLEIMTAKITGDGDSLMASSSVLERLKSKLEARSGHEWHIQNDAHNGYRMGIEVAQNQEKRFFSYRLPWKSKDRVWVIGGTNDLGMGGHERVERLLDAVQNYFKLQQQAGYPKTACFYTDILPRTSPLDPAFDADRRRYNSMIVERLAGLAHVIPSGSNPLLADPLDLNIYFDGTHLTEAGNEIVAEDAFRVMMDFEQNQDPVQ